MSHAKILTRATSGIDAPLVTIEAHLSEGQQKFSLVGLPETTVRESKERVYAALIHCGFFFPGQRVTINLSPADLPKDGGGFDLPIALCLLAASGQIRHLPPQLEVAGELNLDGTIVPIRGAMSMALQADTSGNALILPQANAKTISQYFQSDLRGAKHLKQVIDHINQSQSLSVLPLNIESVTKTTKTNLDDVIGQSFAKRALHIAASGGHHLLMCGPPGTGKTMLANRLIGLLPSLQPKQMQEVLMVHSLSQSCPTLNWQRPFRQPHHTCSMAALVGGGIHPKPGEISLAHQGVLFLDELPEFDKRVLEVLREPIEKGEVIIARSKAVARFPAHFQLVAAMNPCPCGYFGDNTRSCRCTLTQIQAYQHKLSGPLLERIDVHTQLQRPSAQSLLQPCSKESITATMREVVERSLHLQTKRQGKANALLSVREMNEHCCLSNSLKAWLGDSADKLQLSARVLHKTLKVARTIADMADKEKIDKDCLLEAMSLRQGIGQHPQRDCPSKSIEAACAQY